LLGQETKGTSFYERKTLKIRHFIKTKMFCLSKDTVKKMNKLSTDWEISKHICIAGETPNCFVSFLKR